MIEYSRDASGRLTIMLFYHANGTIWYSERFSYFDDRYERRIIMSGNAPTQVEKNYYTADGQNIAKTEVFNTQGQLTSTTTREFSEFRNPNKLISAYFGQFENENIATSIMSASNTQVNYTVSSSIGGYATEVKYSSPASTFIQYELFR